MSKPVRAALLILLCVASPVGVSRSIAQPASSAGCAAANGLEFICGAERPEDLARIPNTRWIIASGFANGAGLKLIDSDVRSMRHWYSGTAQQQALDAQRFPDCHSAPDASIFNAQGVSLRPGKDSRHTLYVVNHGGREAIEIFTVDATAGEPALIWNGCALMPEGFAANSVASYSDGTILASVLTRPGKTITDFWRGEITGGVYEWRLGRRGFQLLPGTELPGNNGIETSRDDRAFYVVAFGWRAVVVFDRANPASSARRLQAPGFMPDNIHWDGDRLLLAGMQYDEPACGGIRKIIDGKADDMRCHRGYTVAELDPTALAFRIVAYSEPNPAFNGVSAAVVVGKSLWLASYQADRVAVRGLPRPE
ncbi:hypothetical protein HNQ60_002405 [Povalibacter uvarum]|uniref:SMP-30/Gluconolactonase/LRE-like region domain-containing protein n=1 Tax=Povalibacter uvarum TaxID=732238 RepID=A0A841HLQ3_9GAMM|nr:hypothetical protein [Povalibacter uvarum]MBB6093524.1 hypothetical protein [Povalibacter uvarum]